MKVLTQLAAAAFIIGILASVKRDATKLKREVHTGTVAAQCACDELHQDNEHLAQMLAGSEVPVPCPPEPDRRLTRVK